MARGIYSPVREKRQNQVPKAVKEKQIPGIPNTAFRGKLKRKMNGLAGGGKKRIMEVLPLGWGGDRRRASE